MGDLRFDGKVVVVTGAGGGLGKEYALLFGSRGASVVVNDLGGSRDGEGKNSKAADLVVQEIRQKGGQAVADYNSVEDGSKIIQMALDAFGRIDVLINNAGILRDKSFLKMTDNDWNLVLKVHFHGSFACTRAAWPHFRKQGYGRIIMTASGAGLYGNFGQSNYSSAKMAAVGLSNTLAREGIKYNIHSNVIVPLAASRLTEDIFPPDVFEQLKPDKVAPAVAWLCHEDCQETGGIFEAFGGNFARYRLERSVGATLPMDSDLSPEKVRDSWEKVNDFTSSIHPSSNEDLMMDMLSIIQKEAKAAKGGIDVDTALQWESPEYKFSYTSKDAILYALGVAVSVSSPESLRYLYEGDPEFSVLPSYGCVIAQDAIMQSGALMGGIPGLAFDLDKVLHGEQWMRLYRDLPDSATVTSSLKVADVMDKKSGALVLIDVTTRLQGGEKLLDAQFSIFVVGAGGFDGKRSSEKMVPLAEIPNTEPEGSVQVETNANQAALYRLSGDLNPLHIDPNFAAMAGFSQPILHGMSTMGSTIASIILKYPEAKLRELKVRFAKPVLPGHHLDTSMWRQEDKILFETKVKETGKSALTGGYLVFKKGSLPSIKSKL